MDTPLKSNVCPRCGPSMWETGKLFKKGSLEDVRYRADAASPLSMKKEVVVRVCERCGYIELYLKKDEW